MLYKKLFGNILITLCSPIFFAMRWWPETFNAFFYGRYEYYDFNIHTLEEFLFYVYVEHYFVIALLALLFVFLPFQVIKDIFSRRRKSLTLFHKGLILSSILLLILALYGTFNAFWARPWKEIVGYLLSAFALGFIFSYLLYWVVDRNIPTQKSRR